MKITIAGCGNMGLIYAKALIQNQIVLSSELLLAEKNEARKEELMKMNVGEVCSVSDSGISGSEMVILAVKPQDLHALASELKLVLRKESLVISIMAGITIAQLQMQLGTKNIVRAMPNSPAALGMGTTAFTSGTEVSKEDLVKAAQLLQSTGIAIYFENEALLDAVTALSGSGPAYFFYLVKHMMEAGRKMGFDEEVAAALVKQTMLGSFHLMSHSGNSLDELIKAVASKGGTTEAALNVFKDKQVGENLQRGIFRARDRATELSG